MKASEMRAREAELLHIMEGIQQEPRKAALRIARLQRQAKKAYGERDELLLFLSRLYPSHLMPITQRTPFETWEWALCIHVSEEGRLIYQLDNEAVEFFHALPRTAEDHYSPAHNTAARTRLLVSGVAQSCTKSTA